MFENFHTNCINSHNYLDSKCELNKTQMKSVNMLEGLLEPLTDANHFV